MSNLTLAIDKQLLKKARHLALERDTTVNAMVRNFLEKEISQSESMMEVLAQSLEDHFKKNSISLGSITWTREELHER